MMKICQKFDFEVNYLAKCNGYTFKSIVYGMVQSYIS